MFRDGGKYANERAYELAELLKGTIKNYWHEPRFYGRIDCMHPRTGYVDAFFSNCQKRAFVHHDGQYFLLPTKLSPSRVLSEGDEVFLLLEEKRKGKPEAAWWATAEDFKACKKVAERLRFLKRKNCPLGQAEYFFRATITRFPESSREGFLATTDLGYHEDLFCPFEAYVDLEVVDGGLFTRQSEDGYTCGVDVGSRIVALIEETPYGFKATAWCFEKQLLDVSAML